MRRNDRIPVRDIFKEIRYYAVHYGRAAGAPIPIKAGETKLIAHRGLSGMEKENTVQAYELACKYPYFGIETDIRMTKDKKILTIHDGDTGRVASVKLIIEENTFESLRAVKLNDVTGKRSDAYRIPTLEEYVEICAKNGKTSVIEFKKKFSESEIIEIVETVRALGHIDNTIFISFDLNNLIILKKEYPALRAQYLTFRYENSLIDMLRGYGLDLDIYHNELTQRRIEKLHENGIAVNCWTVNYKKEAEKLVNWGVDFITTNILIPEE